MEGVSVLNLEKVVYKFVCDLAIQMMEHIIQEYEVDIHKNRDKNRYVANGTRKSNIKMIFGTVEYTRHIYIDKETGDNLYLLDDYLHVYKLGNYSENLVHKMIELVSELSYRQAEEKLELLTGNKISHQGFWNVIQKYGSLLREKNNILSNNLENSTCKGKVKAKALFIEQDGVWLKMQGNDRTRKSSSSEMKIAVSYTGWSNDSTLRYDKLLNKTAIAGFFDTETFYRLTDGLIYNTYDMDKVLYKISNADGAAWTNRSEMVDIFQVDYFHINQAIIRNVRSKEKVKRFLSLLRNKRYDELINEVSSYKTQIKDSKSKKSIKELYEYLYNNKRYLPRWQEKLKLKNESGIKYKNLGVQENQNCTIITRRMKHRKMAWSKAGATNLALVLCERINRQTLEENAVSGKDFKIKKETIIKGINELTKSIDSKKKNVNVNNIAGVPLKGAASTLTGKLLRSMLDEWWL